MPEKKRLDVLVHEHGLAPSREMAQRYIMAGEISVNGEVRTKPGHRVPIDAHITLKESARFVSRGGLKLAGAIEHFNISIAGRICADVGASTGGFTDCLLQNGATTVYAIDTGYGQLAIKLRNNPRVIVMERTNARHLEKLNEPISLAVMDVSFISIRILLPVIHGWLTPQADVISLIKPQFEAGRSDVGKGGIVKDSGVHRRVLGEIVTKVGSMGYGVCGLIQSPITGTKGNIEFLIWLSTQSGVDDPMRLIEPLFTP